MWLEDNHGILNTFQSVNDADEMNEDNEVNSTKKKYKCPIKDCKKQYTTTGSLNRHLKQFHGENPDLMQNEKPEHSKTKVCVMY